MNCPVGSDFGGADTQFPAFIEAFRVLSSAVRNSEPIREATGSGSRCFRMPSIPECLRTAGWLVWFDLRYPLQVDGKRLRDVRSALEEVPPSSIPIPGAGYMTFCKRLISTVMVRMRRSRILLGWKHIRTTFTVKKNHPKFLTDQKIL